MDVAVYVGARSVTVDDYPASDPGLGQVQLTVDLVALCETDLRVFRGELDFVVGRTAVLGHEVSARVAALGGGVSGLEVGEPVTVMPLVSCNGCPPCRAGRAHLCDRITMLGVQLPGGLQRTWNVPASFVVLVPSSLSPEAVALVEPAAIAVHALRMAPVGAGAKVLVVGGGAVGLFVALFAKAAGADVAIVEADRTRRVVGVSAGLQMVAPDRDDVEGFVKTWTSGAGVDTAYEVTGDPAGAAVAVNALAARGRLVLVGGQQDPTIVDFDRVVRAELSVLGATYYERSDFDEAIRLMDEVNISLFITTTKPISAVGEALAALEDEGVMRVLVDLRPEVAVPDFDIADLDADLDLPLE